jgi:hypothetical protein
VNQFGHKFGGNFIKLKILILAEFLKTDLSNRLEGHIICHDRNFLAIFANFLEKLACSKEPMLRSKELVVF